VKSDTPAAPKSASQPDPFGLIVRHKSNIWAFYIEISDLSSFLIEKIKFYLNDLGNPVKNRTEKEF
jgi:hypothetical protein